MRNRTTSEVSAHLGKKGRTRGEVSLAVQREDDQLRPCAETAGDGRCSVYEGVGAPDDEGEACDEYENLNNHFMY